VVDPVADSPTATACIPDFRGLRAILWTAGIVGLGILLLAVADPAHATHYRYGTMSWEPTENANEVVFTGAQAWRSSFFGNPPLGSIVNVGSITTGDGGSVPLNVRVVSINTLNDWFFGIFVDANGAEGIQHTYPAQNNNGQPWEASWSSCCRISPRSSGNYHVNNPDQSMALETRIDLAQVGNSAPRTNLPPIMNCPLGMLCSIHVPSLDNEGDTLSFRLASTTEAGDFAYVPPGTPFAPNPAQIHPTAGTITWDTTGATHDADWANWRTLYSMQVVLEDGRTKTPLDFFIRIIPADAQVPYWFDTSVCGTTQTIIAGNTISFQVNARSDDAQRIITLNHLGIPSGASFPLPAPANPVSGTFTWTPTHANGGSHLIIFTAEDDLGLQAPPCPVTIEVDLQPPAFEAPSPCVTKEIVHGLRGVPLAFDVAARSPLADRTVTLSLTTAPPGAFLVAPPAANPVQGTVHWPDPVAGFHFFVVKATDNLGISATCIVQALVIEPAGQSLVTGLWAGTTVPTSLEYRTAGIDQRTDGSAAQHHVTVSATNVDAKVESLYEEAALELSEVTSRSHARTQILRAELFGGLIVLEGLDQDVTLTHDLETGETTLETTPRIARLEIAGAGVPVHYDGAPIEIPLPGGGMLTLFEQVSEETAQGTLYLENLVHAHLPLPYGRHEAILGSVILQAGHQPPDFPYAAQPRLILGQDDAGSGRDAGSTPGGAVPIATGLYHGSLPPGDRIDYYSVELLHGDKIQLVLAPAARATAVGGAIHLSDIADPDITPPAVVVGPQETYTLRLFDPTGALRERSELPVAGAPQRIELNTDLDGTWHIEVARNPRSSPPTAYNYTLAATITPVPLLPQNEFTTGAPACVPGDPGIPEIGAHAPQDAGGGVKSGVLRDADFFHVYRFHAKLGEIATVILKPGETLDGVDMALILFDPDCNEMQRSNLNLAGLKGLPETVNMLPTLETADYYLGIERVNGVGNYHITLTATNPLPTLPLNDGLSGGDAPTAHGNAGPAPAPVFQGTLHDGDPGDAYLLTLEAGKRSEVTVKMGLLSSVEVRLYRPDGTTLVPQSQNFGGQLVTYVFDAPVTGSYGLEIRPIVGGGNYMVAWGQAPIVLP
jgi:hypothetical protein